MKKVLLNLLLLTPYLNGIPLEDAPAALRSMCNDIEKRNWLIGNPVFDKQEQKELRYHCQELAKIFYCAKVSHKESIPVNLYCCGRHANFSDFALSQHIKFLAEKYQKEPQEIVELIDQSITIFNQLLEKIKKDLNN